MKKHGTVLALLLLLVLIIGTIGCDGEEITPSTLPMPTTTPAYTPTPVPTATSTPSSITFVAPTPTPFGITLVTPTPTPFSITMATPTPTPEPAEWQLGPTIVLVTPTPQLGEGEVIVGEITGLVEMVEPPQPGDPIEVVLNCEAGCEEIIILGQYLELRYYVADLNALEDQAYQALVSALRWAGLWWWPSWDIVPEQGLVVGILQVDCEKVATLPFVANIGVLPEPGDWVILEELLRELAAGDVDSVITLSEEIAD